MLELEPVEIQESVFSERSEVFEKDFGTQECLAPTIEIWVLLHWFAAIFADNTTSGGANGKLPVEVIRYVEACKTYYGVGKFMYVYEGHGVLHLGCVREVPSFINLKGWGLM